MNIYAEFIRMANSHVVTIKDCEVLTSDIYNSAQSFISNALKWDSGAYRQVSKALNERLLADIYKAEYMVEYNKRYQEPISNNSYEYGNEIAQREADKLAYELIEELKGKDNDTLYRKLKEYNND